MKRERKDELFMIQMIDKYILNPNYKDYTIVKGTDPPDYLITIGTEKIALELTNIYSLFAKDGKLENTSLYIFPLDKIKDSLNRSLGMQIDPQTSLAITLLILLNDYDAFKTKIESSISHLLANDYLLKTEGSFKICSDNIRWKKIVNTNNSPKIRILSLPNTNLHSLSVDYQILNMIEKAVSNKNMKMKAVDTSIISQKWLCLRNNYICASEENYSLAIKKLNIEHDFSKILIIDSEPIVYEYDCKQLNDNPNNM